MSGLDSRLSTYWPKKRYNESRCSQHTSTDQTPISCAPVASPELKPNGRMWRADAPALSNRTGLAWAAKPINAATPGLGTSVCYLPMKRHLWNWLHYEGHIRLRRTQETTSDKSASWATFAQEGRSTCSILEYPNLPGRRCAITDSAETPTIQCGYCLSFGGQNTRRWSL